MTVSGGEKLIVMLSMNDNSSAAQSLSLSFIRRKLFVLQAFHIQTHIIQKFKLVIIEYLLARIIITAHRIDAYNPIHPLISFEHLILYIHL